MTWLAARRGKAGVGDLLLANLRTVSSRRRESCCSVYALLLESPIGIASVGDAAGVARHLNEKEAAVQTEMLLARGGGIRGSIRETMSLATWRQRRSGGRRAAGRVVEDRHASFVNRRDRLELDRLSP